MIRATKRTLAVLLTTGLVVSSPGCISVKTDGFALDSIGKSKLSKVQMREEVPETPPDPEHPERLQLAYARWMEVSGQPDEARKNYESVLQVEPENVNAILGMARLNQQTGQAAEAEKGFQKALELSPQHPEAHFGLGRLYGSQNRWSDAIGPLEKALALNPNDSDYRYQYGLALAQTGRTSEALPHFIRTIGDAEAHYNVALILKDQGRLPEAERHLQIALQKKPEFAAAHHWLAQMQHDRRGDSVEAAGHQVRPLASPSTVVQTSHESFDRPLPEKESMAHLNFPAPLTPGQREQRANQRPAPAESFR
ncbi:MAG: tetratricopeptide repeat protein [Planctomycetaceae bacterium]|nr:tetratricopeptide repeat protein [Planctomycetaceae bacterium]